MGNNLLAILIAVLFILLFIIGVYVYAMNLRAIAAKKFMALFAVVRVRQDIVPGLIETVKKYVDAKDLVKQVVSARRNAFLDFKDINMAELDFLIKKLIRLEKKSRKLRCDLDFLEAKTCLAENFEKMRRAAIEYNIIVSKHNKFVGVFGKKIPLYKV